MKKIFSLVTIMMVLFIMNIGIVAAQEQQVHSDNETIEAIISQPWISYKDGRMMLTMGDAMQRHFNSTNWGMYKDKYGNQLVGFTGEVMTGMGYTVSVEYYMAANPDNPKLMYFKMGNQDQPILMGVQLLKEKRNEDLISFTKGELS